MVDPRGAVTKTLTEQPVAQFEEMGIAMVDRPTVLKMKTSDEESRAGREGGKEGRKEGRREGGKENWEGGEQREGRRDGKYPGMTRMSEEALVPALTRTRDSANGLKKETVAVSPTAYVSYYGEKKETIKRERRKERGRRRIGGGRKLGREAKKSGRKKGRRR